MTENDDLTLRLNQETARIGWASLQPHFARGSTVYVCPDLDLVEVAACFARDDSAAIRAWMDGGEVARVSAEQAAAWHDQACEMWAVVVAPWVLVQPA